MIMPSIEIPAARLGRNVPLCLTYLWLSVHNFFDIFPVPMNKKKYDFANHITRILCSLYLLPPTPIYYDKGLFKILIISKQANNINKKTR